MAPKHTTVAAVNKAKHEVKSHKRGLDKMKKMGMDTSTVRTAEGVG